MNSIGDRIEILITKILKIEKKGFAEKIGKSPSAVTSWTEGRRYPAKPAIDKICKEFNVNPDWLVNGEGKIFLPPTLDQATIDYYNLNEQEQKLILKFRLLPPDRQSIAVGIMDGLAEPYENHYDYREELSA